MGSMNRELTEWTHQLKTGDCLPADARCIVGESFVDAIGDKLASVEEQLEGHDNETTERRRDDFRLIDAGLVSVSG